MPASPTFIFPVFRGLRKAAKGLLYLLVAVYICLALGVLAVRYLILPNLNHWREPLQARLSAVLPVEVEIGDLVAVWDGLHPRVSVYNTVLLDDDGRTLLRVPELDAVIAWQSLFLGMPRFLSLQAQGMEFSVRRDIHDRISLAGYEVDGLEVEGDDEGGEAARPVPGESGRGAAVLRWLAEQGSVTLIDTRILWMDDHRSAPPLLLRDVVLGYDEHNGEHLFSLQANPPDELGEAFELLARFRIEPSPGPVALSDVSGLFYMHVEDMLPRGWAPWIDVRDVFEQGRISWRAWQEAERGELGRHVSRITVEDGVWQPLPELGLRARSADLHVEGPWDALHAVWFGVQEASSEPLTGQGRMTVQLQDLVIEAPGMFAQALTFDEIAVATGARRDPGHGLLVNVETAQLRNADMALDFSGQWTESGAGQAGTADFSGDFKRAELAAIARYLPLAVDQEAIAWMQAGLLGGRLVDASVRLSGDLMQFPFGEHPERGEFSIAGRVQDGVIDYAPATLSGPPGWPRIEALQGQARLDKVDLTIHADSMQMRPRGLPIHFSNVTARIPDLEQTSILDVDGTARAQGEAFMALLQASPLSDLMGGMFDGSRAGGQWEVPIALQIPLEEVARTSVKGAVVLKDGMLQLEHGFPPLSSLKGKIGFTESEVTAEGVSGRVLGGPFNVTGGMGKSKKALGIQGTLTVDALQQYLQQPLEPVMSGKASYLIEVRAQAGNTFSAKLESDLEGLALSLPPPLHKEAGQRMALVAHWTPMRGKQGARLDVDLANGVALRLVNGRSRKDQPYFAAGALTLKGKPVPPSEGMAIDVSVDVLDLDAWRKVLHVANEPSKTQTVPVLPALRDLRLRAGTARVLGMELEHLAFTARQPGNGHWRVDISSTQTAGTVYWRERKGAIEGEVDAQFQRLALGTAAKGETHSDKTAGSEEGSRLFNAEEEVSIPAVRFKADRFSVYGRELGSISVVGVNEDQGRRWRLQELELGGEHAHLKGQGVWQLTGTDRGLSLDLDAQFNDLGAWLTQMDIEDMVAGGQGHIRGKVKWRNIPWHFELAGLQGTLATDLQKGRLLTLGSRSARLLELLSLQSVSRLASLSWNPTDLMKQGFPFDLLAGNVTITRGVAHSENFRVESPVANIAIVGDVDLPKESLDLHAIVVPNLDVSGAAIAAGIAVNPIVGVGAFLTQWLLKHPMSKAMTVEYRVKGHFDSPQISEVRKGTEKP